MSKKRQLETVFASCRSGMIECATITAHGDRVSTIQKLMESEMAKETTAERNWRRALGRIYDRHGSAKTRHDYQQRPIFLACIAR